VSLLIRALIHYDFERSALLYVGIPFVIAIALLFIERPKQASNWKRRYINLVLLSLIIMLGSSVVLFEGFVCVVMFMPIYFGIVLLMFLFEALRRFFHHRQYGRYAADLLSLVILLSAFEGVVEQLSFEREYSVAVEQVIAADIAQIKKQLTRPIELNKSRHPLLALFPMPYAIEAGTLNAGDVHRLNFRYHRWFVTNTHEGSMALEISEVQDYYIRTQFIEDSSYISSYIQLHGTEIRLQPLGDGHTKVSLTIHYKRILDPVWYFGPLQQFVIGETAQFLLDHVITPQHSGDLS